MRSDSYTSLLLESRYLSICKDAGWTESPHIQCGSQQSEAETVSCCLASLEYGITLKFLRPTTALTDKMVMARVILANQLKAAPALIKF